MLGMITSYPKRQFPIRSGCNKSPDDSGPITPTELGPILKIFFLTEVS